MVRRALLLLAATAGLAACVAPGAPPPYAVGGAASTPPGPRPVAVLLPLSGRFASVGHAMLQAVQLAMAGAPMDVQDTGGTAPGAARAVSIAIAAHDALILGPLTAGETQAVAGPARQAGIPVLAFTNDSAAAQPGVWTLGITPAQQVRRMVAAAASDGRTQLVAVLPRTAYGDALAQAFGAPGVDAGAVAVSVQQYAGGFQGLNDALKSATQYDARKSEAAAQGAPAAAGATPGAAPSQPGPLPPPPFNALFLAEAGVPLQEAISLLPYYGIGQPAVRVMGPSLWAGQVSHLGALAGAWYPAPDPAARAGFVQLYLSRYGTPPPTVADLAFDAGALARVLGAGPGYGTASLTKPDGFAGTDGLFALLPDGHVRRGLAVFEITPGGGARMVQPAPRRLPAPGV